MEGKQREGLATVASRLLSGVMPAEGMDEWLERLDMPETELNMQAAIMIGIAKDALGGNIRAAEFLFDKAKGEGETQGKAWQGLPARVLGKGFVDVYRDMKARRHRRYDFRGGRGSLKSSFCALALIDELESHSHFCAIAIREVKDTLKDSCYAQIKWAIDELGLTEQYHCTKSPLEIVRAKTGQVIFFRGVDDPLKMKSIKPPNGMHLGMIWIEEADQLKGEATLRSILQSCMRGGDDVLLLRSYNTPVSPLHYMNVEALTPRPDRLIHHSHFKDAPREWLGTPFFEEAAFLKQSNELFYRHEYDGEAVGTGGHVFENVVLRAITPEEMQQLNYVHNGGDFGFAVDPDAFVQTAYDKRTHTLTLKGEVTGTKMQAQELAAKVKALMAGEPVCCDSAEPRMIAQLKQLGVNSYAAKKGPDSVAHGIRWLQSLRQIVIDPALCPLAAREFSSYEYERDKEGNFISAYPDKNNHTIDAVRYAVEAISLERVAKTLPRAQLGL